MSQQENYPTPEDLPKLEEQPQYPVSQEEMPVRPDSDLSNYRPAGKLQGKVAIITGGDSGIGRAVAIAYAMEGADVAIVFDQNREDAEVTRQKVEQHGRRCLVIQADLSQSAECQRVVDETVREFGKLDILVNSAAYQMTQQTLEDITDEQFLRTVHTNLGGYFWMIRSALPHLQSGASIINTGSIVGFQGNPSLVDYAATKGAIHNLTNSLAQQLGPRGIRVNCVAPGPIWTPLIPGTMPPEKVEQFGADTPLGRPGQPEEVAPVYVHLAADESSYTSGAIIKVTGGRV